MNNAEKLLLMSKKPRTNHILHLLLSVVTAGAWVPAWIIIALVNQQRCANIERKVRKG